MAEIQMYNYPKTDLDIKNKYKLKKSQNDPGLVLYYSFKKEYLKNGKILDLSTFKNDGIMLGDVSIKTIE